MEKTLRQIKEQTKRGGSKEPQEKGDLTQKG